MTSHKTGTREQWLAARLQLLQDEKELTRRSDELARRRQELPWYRIDKDYRFDTDQGPASLADLFQGRSQLLAYNIMFGPDYTLGACPGCTSLGDGLDGGVVHLNHRDITMAAVSRAPYAKLAAYKKRMGWGFPWLSSLGSDFNFDYRVSFTDEELKAEKVDYNYRVNPWGITEGPGISVFLKDGGQIYHTYSTYERGLDMLNVAYHYMDLVPKGRDEGNSGGATAWVRRRDEYQG